MPIYILLRSGDDGLPVFMRRFVPGYAVAFNRRHGRCGHLFQKRIEQARQRVAAVCRSEGVSENALSSGSRHRGVSAVRRRLAMELTVEIGLSLAETARQLGVSASAVHRIVKAD